MDDLKLLTWFSREWSSWQQMGEDKLSIPQEPGLYCFRTQLSTRMTDDPYVIAYIGESKDLHRRICRDWRGKQQARVDPDTTGDKKIKFFAQWRDYPSQFEASFCTNSMTASHDLTGKRERRAVEAYAAWRCRVETGRSAVANHQRATYALADEQDEKKQGKGHWYGDILPSMPPLELAMFPADPGWMGLEWTRFGTGGEMKPSSSSGPDQDIHDASLQRPALYKILDLNRTSVLEVGFRKAIGKGLRSELSDLKPKIDKHPVGAWAHLPPGTPCYCYAEMRDDLIGAHYSQTGNPPAFQFKGDNSAGR